MPTLSRDKWFSCFVVSVLVFFLFFPAFPAVADPLEDCAQHVRYGAPSEDPDILCRLSYVLSHDGEHKVPRWVAYRLTGDRMDGPIDRTDNFRPDPDLTPGQRAELEDYRLSGYDRGHQMPAATNRWSEQAMSESFLLSNMAPQVGISFNRGIWSVPEGHVRNWAVERGELYVVTGSVIVGQPLDQIGPNQVAVPTHFYKMVYDPVRVEALAFLLPNAAQPAHTLPAYVTSVRHIERLTGLDFLNRLQAPVQDLIETSVPDIWE